MNDPYSRGLKSERKPTGTWMVVVAAIGLLALGGIVLLGLSRILLHSDLDEAARKLDGDVVRAKAAGVPLVAADFSPKPPVKDSENAAPLIYKAIHEYQAIPESSRYMEFLLDATGRNDSAGTKTLLAEADLALKTAKEAAAKPHCDFRRDWDMGPVLMMPELGETKNLARVLGLRAIEEAREGKHTAAVDDLRAATALINDAGTNPIMLSLLIRTDCDSRVAGAAESCMAEAKSPSDMQMYVDFLSSQRPVYDLTNYLDGEAYLGVTVYRNLKQFGDLETLSHMDRKLPTIDPAKLTRSGMPTSVADRAYMARHLEMWTNIYEQCKPLKNDPRAFSKKTQEITDAMESQSEDSYLYEKVLGPVFSGMGDAVMRGQSRWATKASLSKVLLFKAQHGLFPKTLAEAGADLSDPYTGKTLLYKKSGNGVLVYSVGVDGTDDGGIRRHAPFTDASGKDLPYDEVASYPAPKYGPSTPAKAKKP